MTDYLSLHDAAVELGVHYMTVYRYVRTGLLPASKPNGTWQVQVQDLDDFQARVRPSGTEATGGLQHRLDWHARYEARILDGDDAGAWSIIEGAMLAGRSKADIYLDVIGPAMHSIGERWVAEGLEISREHRATVVARHHVGRLAPRFVHRGRSKGSVVLGCLAGERHDIGVSMVADLLRAEGYDVTDLGPDVPLDSFVETALDWGPHLLAVGISLHDRSLLAAAEEVASAVRALDSEPLVVIGGHGVIGLDTEAVGPDCVVGDARSVCELVGSVRDR